MSLHTKSYSVIVTMGGGIFLKVGGVQVQVKKTIEIFCGLNRQLRRHKY